MCAQDEDKPPTPQELKSVAEPMDVDGPSGGKDMEDQVTMPLTRYNAMVAIVKNTLYLYVIRPCSLLTRS
jgi:hypothetical protein